MKEIYLLRHGEKDNAGMLTERGRRAAEALRQTLPQFSQVLSSETPRAIESAVLLTGKQPQIDPRAMYATASPEHVDEINTVSIERGVSFLNAAILHANTSVLDGIDRQARALNDLIDEVLEALPEGERALIVSHDLTIVPAMTLRGGTSTAIDPLAGYTIQKDGNSVAVLPYPPQIA